MNMIRIRLFLLFVIICGIFSSAFAEPYYNWINEYDGTSPNTLYLWNFNDGELTGTPTPDRTINVAASGPAPRAVLYGYTEFVPAGKFGGGVQLYGGAYSADFLYPYPAITDTFAGDKDPSFTIETWVKFDDISQQTQWIIDKQYTNKDGFQFRYYNDSYSKRFTFSIGNGTTLLNVSGLVPDIEANKWYHVAATWDAVSDTAKVFLDGKELNSVTSAGFSYVENTKYIKIGNRQGSVYGIFAGILDGFRISKVAYDFAVLPECGDPGTSLVGDINGPVGIPDCEIDYHDIEDLASRWLNNVTPSGGTPPSFFAPAPDISAGMDQNKIYPAGKKFLFSMFSVLNQNDRIAVKNSGLTAIGPYYGTQALAEANSLGLKYIQKIEMILNFNDSGFVMPSDSEIQTEITNQVNSVVNDSTIIMWYLKPEELVISSSNQMHYLEVATAAIRAADPKHRPIWNYIANHRSANDIAPIISKVDICGEGMYPNNQGYETERAYCKWVIEQELAAIANANSNGIPIAVPEMFANPSQPDLIDSYARHDTYLSLITGAKGVVVYYGFRATGFTSFDAYLNAYMKIASELKEFNLTQALLFGEKRQDINVSVTSGPATVTVSNLPGGTYTTSSVNYINLADSNGVRHLLLANSANSSVTVTISGLPAQTILRRDAFNSDKYITMTTGSFSTTLDALGVKYYRFVPQPQHCSDEGVEFIISDLNKDCIVNFADYVKMAEQWLECGLPSMLCR
jgi:hypothetical protein